MPNVRIGVSDTHCEQFIQDVIDDLNRVVAGLVANRVAYEESTARQCRRAPHFRMVLIQVREGTVVDELVQYVTCQLVSALCLRCSGENALTTEVKGMESGQCQRNKLRAPRAVSNIHRYRLGIGSSRIASE